MSLKKKSLLKFHFCRCFSNSNDPIYFIKIEEKSLTENELRDQFGHVVFKGECTLEKVFKKSTFEISINNSVQNNIGSRVDS